MPIKPVDFQIMIPRTVDASKNQNDNHSKVFSIQKATNIDVKQEADKSLRQVQHRDKAYKTGVDKDAKGRKGNGQEEEKRHHDKDTDKGADSGSKSTVQSSVHIDIKI